MFQTKSDQNTTSNESFIWNCQTPQEFNTSDGFFHCFQELFYNQIGFSIFLMLLIFFTGFLNILVIVLLIRKRPGMSVFDKLIIILCFCDTLNGIADAPFYSIIQLFGYWPLNYWFGIVWTAFDSGINTVNMLCMLHMTYARLRSLQAPSTYERELVIKMPFISAIVYWTLSYAIWIPLTIGFGTAQFTTGINFQPYYVAPIVHFFLYFFPLAVIVFMSIYIVLLLYIRNRRKHNRKMMNSSIHSKNHTGASVASHSQAESITTRISRKKSVHIYVRKCFHIGPQTKFLIIIISYWIQWLPSFLIYLFNPFCNCVPNNVNIGIYWLTYSVSMTNPIVVLIFNPNVAVSKTNLVHRN